MGLVFVNSSAPNLPYFSSKISERVTNATNRMKNVWKIEDCDLRLIIDPSKETVQDIFEQITLKAR